MDRYFIDTTANKCQFNYSCLNCKSGKPCKVTDCVNNKVIFVNAEEDCNYNLSYGLANICLCPVRKELFLKYQT